MQISIRQMSADDAVTWARLRCALWPDESAADLESGIYLFLADPEMWAFIAEDETGTPHAFAETALRKYANGCEQQPVPFLEGIWVAPDARRQGVAQKLIDHIGAFFRAKGFTEMCSDALIDNHVSHAAHAGWGFTETERVVYFRKPL